MSDLKREADALGRVAAQLRARHGWDVHLRAKARTPLSPVTACGSREGAGLLGSTTDDPAAVTCARCLRGQAPQRPDPKPVLDGKALYFTDNGAVYCGKHCGASARFTGRDISGQKVQRLTPEFIVSAKYNHGRTIKCETCGATGEAPTSAAAAQRPDSHYQYKAARADMALARKKGEIAVAETRVGTVFVAYEAGVYTITKAGLDAHVLASGESRDVLPVLADLYVVERR